MLAIPILWPGPPSDLPLTCPPPPPGEPIDPTGFFDPAVLEKAYSTANAAVLALAVLLLVLCYLWTSSSLGPRFVRRWTLFVVGTALAALVAATAIVALWPARALANSCETNPEPFAARVPFWEALQHGMSGTLLAVLAFVVLSLLLTRLAGRYPWTGGLFHYRGCPWPRPLKFFGE